MAIDHYPHSIRLIAIHAERWRNVSLSIEEAQLRGPIFQTLKGRLNMLEHLELATDEFSDASVLDVFSDLPKLRSLRISHTGPGGDEYNISLPWHQVDSVTKIGDYVQEFLQSIGKCKEATSFTMYDGAVDQTSQLVPVRSEKLEDLVLQVSDSPINIPPVPGITHIGVHTVSTVLSFLRIHSYRKSSRVSLNIQKFPLSDNVAITLLRSLPSLVDLTIHESPVIADVTLPAPILTRPLLQSMHAYLPNSFSPPVLTNLQRLSFVAESSSFDEALFVDMVKSWFMPPRGAAVACIESLYRRVNGHRTQCYVAEDLWNMHKSGMLVDVAIGGQCSIVQI